MKKSFSILKVLIFTLITLFSFSSCGSTPEAAEKTFPAGEEPQPGLENTDATSAENQTTEQSEIPVQQNLISLQQNEVPEQQEQVSEEKIDDGEILQNPVEADEAETFVEPDVKDAPVTDTEKAKETETVQVSENIHIEENNKDLDTTQSTQIIKTAPVTVSDDSTKSINTEKAEETESAKVSDTKNEETEEKQTEESSVSEVDIFQNPAVIVPSRSMQVKTNQFVDVVYPGSGWIYIGETETDPRFRYFGRKLGTENTTFTLRSIKTGKTYLHFYKNDVLTQQYIDDYLEVEVVNEKAKANEKATAPSYAEVVPPKPVRGVTSISPEKNSSKSENALTNEEKNKSPSTASVKKEAAQVLPQVTSASTNEDKNVKTIISSADEDKIAENSSSKTTKSTVSAENSSSGLTQDTSSKPAAAEETVITDSSKSLLEQAKSSLKEKKYEQALAQIQSYLDTATTKIDEAYYIQGQILEADSTVKNIRSAIDSYDTVIKKYPASKWWSASNKRKIFLNRFYVNIY